jgi:hypothetical protein
METGMKSNTKQQVKQANSLNIEPPAKPKAKDYNMTVKILLRMVIFFGIIAIVIVCAAFAFVYQANDHAQSRAFVVTDMGTLYAYSNLAEDPRSRRVEIENHVRLFMSYMFSFDEGNYKEHIEKGLHLVGNDGKAILQQYNQIDLYPNLVKNNIKIDTYVDSIWVDVKVKPYRARVFSRQNYENSSSREQFWLWADMKLRDVSRTAENVHGLKIENWEIVKKGKIQ